MIQFVSYILINVLFSLFSSVQMYVEGFCIFFKFEIWFIRSLSKNPMYVSRSVH